VKGRERPGIVNAMHHEGFNKAVKALGRKKLFVAGITRTAAGGPCSNPI
jgi:hypothetical protein